MDEKDVKAKIILKTDWEKVESTMRGNLIDLCVLLCTAFTNIAEDGNEKLIKAALTSLELKIMKMEQGSC